MTKPPFSEQFDQGVLTLWLDTPACEVNIFTDRAAIQLELILSELERRAVRAVVIRSKKPGSFVNGAQLMMANTVREAADVPRLTSRVRRAYRALRQSRVPTIAAIAGCCFGCGVELTLHADFRVACTSFDTQFYMTELADYLLVPTFGSTRDLPRLLGIEAATDFLLWGARWRAEAALAHGLVDATFAPDQLDDGVEQFVDDVLAGRLRPRPVDMSEVSPEFVASTERRIDELPPAYRPLYAECFELLVEGAELLEPTTEDYDRETEACGRSLINPISKAALSFFFVRQLAKAASTRKLDGTRTPVVSSESAPTWKNELERRGLLVANERSNDDDTLTLLDWGESCNHHMAVAIHVGPLQGAIAWTTPISAYAPSLDDGPTIVEVSTRTDTRGLGLVVDLLLRAGFTPLTTGAERAFVIDELVDSFLSPLATYVELGGSCHDVARSLKTFGFVRPASDLARRFGHRAEKPLMDSDADLGRQRVELVDAALLSVTSTALRLLEHGEVGHPAVVDVIAREFLDFPLGLGSLCRYSSFERVTDMANRAESLPELVDQRALEHVHRYTSKRQNLYL